MLLDEMNFKNVIRSTPLVSIDLILTNMNKEVLLGFRNNKPAQGFWFVPGGRILKDETIEKAFVRIGEMELNKTLDIHQAKFIGNYQHFYQDNFFDSSFTTHYIVLAYKLELELNLNIFPKEQHSCFEWFSKDRLLRSKDVHTHTKMYF